MIPKRLDEITLEDLELLVSNGVAEGKTIEYKERLPGSSDLDKRELLADVSSFANATGGDLVYGIREERDEMGKSTGVPEAVVGLGRVNLDEVKLRLEQIVRDGIDPRPRVDFGFVESAGNGPALILRIPQSWASPHMVVFKGSSRFYSRGAAGKYQLDVRQIGEAFLLSGQIEERMRRWRDDRLAKILAQETPVPVFDLPLAILHALPFGAFSPQVIIDGGVLLDQARSLCDLRYLPLATARLNFEGAIGFASREIRGQFAAERYVQLFRNGCLELVHASCTVPDPHRPEGPRSLHAACEPALVDGTRRFLEALRSLDLEPPIFLSVAFFKMENVVLPVARSSFDYDDLPPLPRSMMVFPEILVDRWEVEVPALLKDTLDMLWQAGGYPGSQNYGEDGSWRPVR